MSSQRSANHRVEEVHLEVDLAFVNQRRDVLQTLDRALGALLDPSPGDAWMEGPGRVAADALLDDDAFHREHELVHLGHRRRVAAEEGDRAAEIARHRAVEGALRLRPPVDASLGDSAVVVGVVDHGIPGAGRSVVADEEGGVESGPEAGAHVEQAGLAADQLGGRVELLRDQVPALRVGVVDDELLHAGLQRPLDGGVAFQRHQAAGVAVLGRAGRALLGVDDTGDTLDVDGDEDLQSAVTVGASRCSGR